MKFSTIAASALLCLTTSLTAYAESEVDFTYVDHGAQTGKWGTNKLENYDVAIRLADGALSGTKVLGFTCPLGTAEGLANVRAWVSPRLSLKDGVNQPQGVSVEAKIDPATATVTVTFPEPYVITREGAYVGLSFDVTELTPQTGAPLRLAQGEVADAMWIHTSRTYRKWRTLDNRRYMLPMSVKLAGEFSDNCLAIASMPEMRVAANTPFEITLDVTNLGKNRITDIDYTYTIGTTAEEGHIDLENSIPAKFGAKSEITIPVKAISDWGNQKVEIAITKLNGQPNQSPNASIEGNITIVGFNPVMRPLMEEYTGLWCGFCPRGYIALERMKELYPDRFVAISIHLNGRDPMQTIRELPSTVSSFPKAVMNRSAFVDPYQGGGNADFGIELDWLKLSEKSSIADIEAALGWTDDTHSEYILYSRVRFNEDIDNADYRIAFALVGDGIREIDGEEFSQSNYFAGDNMVGDDWKVFTEGEEHVTGLTFNDICLKYDTFTGTEGSVPSTIRYGEWYSYSTTCEADFPNIYGKAVVTDLNKVRVVAMLFDGNGRFINCVSSGYPGTSGIGAPVIDREAEVTSVAYYDLQGRHVTNPAPGRVYIRVDRYSDGHTVPSKVRF